jgi:hypothetical protein
MPEGKVGEATFRLNPTLGWNRWASHHYYARRSS